MTQSRSHPLALLTSTGRKAIYQHWQSWENPADDPFTVDRIVAEAQKAEEIGIDAVFQADFIGLHRADVRRGPVPPYDTMQLAAIIAARVPRINLITTLSVLFSDPYTVARQLISLDQISQGRLAWNLVTSFNGERNFGFDELPPAAERYERAAEFLEVVKKLWASWPVAANRPNPQTGFYGDDSLIKDINHRGRFYSVEGAIDVPPRSDELPLLIQAGASPEGIDSAIQQAHAMFIAAPTADEGEKLVGKIRSRAAELGRDPATLRFIFAVRATLGNTVEQAERRFAQPLAEAEVDIVRRQVEREIEGLELGAVDLDAPLPPELFNGPEVEAALQRRRSRIEIFRNYAAMPDQTLRGMLTRIARRGSHAYVVGTPEMLADELSHWYDRGIADGFILGGDIDLDIVGEKVIPALRARGVVDAHHPDRTLEATLGITRAPPTLREAED